MTCRLALRKLERELSSKGYSELDSLEISNSFVDGYRKIVEKLCENQENAKKQIKSNEKRISNLEARVDRLENDNRILMDNRTAINKMMTHVKSVVSHLPMVEDLYLAAIAEDSTVVFFSSEEKVLDFFDISRAEMIQILASQKKLEVSDIKYRLVKINKL
jgi:hypothetical protein